MSLTTICRSNTAVDAAVYVKSHRHNIFRFYAVSLKAITPIATDVTVAWSVRLYVVCHTLLKSLDGMRCHLAGTLVWSSNIVLDKGPRSLHGGDLGSEPPVRSDAAYRRITLVPLIFLFNYDPYIYFPSIR